MWLVDAVASWDWAFIGKTILGAGLGSAVVQTVFTIVRERRERADRAAYLAMRLAVQLEAFASECADLILKNDTAYEPPDEPLPDWDTRLPKMPDYPTDAEGWRSIDRALAGQALDLVNRVEGGRSMIRSVGDYQEESLGDEVAIQAASRGLEAVEIARGLRRKHKVSAKEPVWDYETTLLSAKEKVLAEREAERVRRQEKEERIRAGLKQMHAEGQI